MSWLVLWRYRWLPLILRLTPFYREHQWRGKWRCLGPVEYAAWLRSVFFGKKSGEIMKPKNRWLHVEIE